MAARRGNRSRVVFSSTGAAKWMPLTDQLPRTEFVDEFVYDRPYDQLPEAVDLERWFPWGTGRSPVSAYSRGRSLPSRLRWQVPPLAKRFFTPSWKMTLNSMPSRVQFCVRRKRRREVLFALGNAGRSGSAPKRHYRRSWSSAYGC